MKGRIILLALVVLLASVASAAIFKYPVAVTAAEGEVINADGTTADGTITAGALSADRPIGIILQIEGTDGYVVNSGVIDLAIGGAVAGDLVGFTAAGVPEVVTAGSGRPVVGIAISATRIMVTIKDDRAEEVNYEWTETTTFLGGATNPNDVQEAIDLMEAYLTASLGSAFMAQAIGATTAIGSTADVVLVTLTPAPPTGADPITAGDEVLITFEGTFDDGATTNGAVVTVDLLFEGSSVQTRTINLVDRDFYQSQTVYMSSYQTVATTGVVQAQADGNSVYDGGQVADPKVSFQRF